MTDHVLYYIRFFFLIFSFFKTLFIIFEYRQESLGERGRLQYNPGQTRNFTVHVCTALIITSMFSHCKKHSVFECYLTEKSVTFLNRAFSVYKQFILSVYIPLHRGGALNWLSETLESKVSLSADASSGVV